MVTRWSSMGTVDRHASTGEVPFSGNVACDLEL